MLSFAQSTKGYETQFTYQNESENENRAYQKQRDLAKVRLREKILY